MLSFVHIAQYSAGDFSHFAPILTRTDFLYLNEGRN